MFVDSHCHLDKLDYKSDHSEIAEVIEKAKASNVTEILSVGAKQATELKDVVKALPLDRLLI